MGTFQVELGADSHPVHVGKGILDQIGALALEARLKPGRAVIISDSNVSKLYGNRAVAALEDAGFAPKLIEVPAGEASKSLEMLSHLYNAMTDAELDRQGVAFALGGGVIGDLAGFAAATWLRGIAIVQVPTTVVAQVDSALGGKTGINHPRAKNLLGVFHQPRLVAADVETLATLPDREFREGLAEVVKYAAIMDAPMLDDLERDLAPILARDPAILESIVERSLRHKAAVVEKDPREASVRKLLNFGHTIGHALEASLGYGTLLHGEAVAIGMVAASAVSRRYAGLPDADAKRLLGLLQRVGLPTAMPERVLAEDLMRAIRLDKKRADQAIDFILIDQIGHAFAKKLSLDVIAAALS